MSEVRELYEIFKRNFPFIVRDKGVALGILGHKDNVVFEERDAQNALVGAAVINRSTILMLCVDEKYRGRGIGSRLLKKAEEAVKESGFEQVNVGNGFDYLAPGVPTAKRYFAAENERLYPGLDETASDFFAKRGYFHSWECNCFDMRFPLSEFEESEVGKNKELLQYCFEKESMVLQEGDETGSTALQESGKKDNVILQKNDEKGGMVLPKSDEKKNVILQEGDEAERRLEKNENDRGLCLDGITYRLAKLSDRDAVCACTEDAFPEFTQYYKNDTLYREGNGTRVLIAVSGNVVAGTLIAGVEEKEKSLGSVGCTAVRQSWRGRHIAVNLVAVGIKYLKEMGLREAYLSYTYSGLDHMYGYAGYKICVYFMMAVKNIGG